MTSFIHDSPNQLLCDVLMLLLACEPEWMAFRYGYWMGEYIDAFHAGDNAFG